MESTSNPPFPFLRLPGELRNKIYEYVFSGWNMSAFTIGGTNIIGVRYHPIIMTGPDYNNWRLYMTRLKNYTALTETCRQIRHEARLLPVKYSVISKWCPIDHLARWLNSMDEDMREVVLAKLTDKQRWCLGERSERKKRIMDL
jgi:hypothetical protein